MKKIALVALSVLSVVVGCAVESSNEDPTIVSVDVDGVGPSQYMTYGSWNANASQPTNPAGYYVQGGSSLGGPAGQSTLWSVCLVELTTRTCNTPSDCNGVYNPYGGPVTCVAPDHVGTQYCAVWPGPKNQVCAGSTVTTAPVTPGYYTTPQVYLPLDGKRYISQACFGACNNSNRSASPSYTHGSTCFYPPCDGSSSSGGTSSSSSSGGASSSGCIICD